MEPDAQQNSSRERGMAFNKPNIFDFLEVIAYLQAHMEWRRSLEPSFSYSQWASELGFKSRTFLRFILTGQRRITDNSILLFKKGLKLNNQESQYFDALVKRSQANTSLEKNEFTKEIAKILRSQKRPMVHNSYHFLSSFIAPRLLVLLGSNGKHDVESLAKTLGTSENLTRNCLETMAELQLIETWQNGSAKEYWRRCQRTSLSINDTVANPAIQSFHRKSLKEAQEAIDLPIDQRNLQSVVLPLKEEDYRELCQSITDFIQLKIKQYKLEETENYRIYQMNMNLIPVSNSFLHEVVRVPENCNGGNEKVNGDKS